MKTLPWWRTNFDEREVSSLADAVANENISQGEVTRQFEQLLAKALQVPFVAATTSGSMAILMSLMAAGIGPGDEVIVPNRTWIATAHAPFLLGAQPVLVDVRPDLPIMDVGQLEKKITPRTRAIIPVHLNGREADLEAIRPIAECHDLVVIEDAAQALFSRDTADRCLGTTSKAGCFSLSIAKLISTGQGGFVATADAAFYRKLTLIRGHGVQDVINVSYSRPGFNFRFTDLLAAVGVIQFSRVRKRIGHLKKIYAKYAAGLAELRYLDLIPVDVSAGQLPLYIEVLCENRPAVMDYLAANGIQTRPFYPDLNDAGYLNATGTFPNSRCFAEKGLFLPGGPAMPLEEIDRVIHLLRHYK